MEAIRARRNDAEGVTEADSCAVRCRDAGKRDQPIDKRVIDGSGSLSLSLHETPFPACSFLLMNI